MVTDALLDLPEIAPETVGSAAQAQLAQSRLLAQVAVDVPLPHLDRLFDYLVPDSLPGAASPEDVAPGVRVKVVFAGRERDGWVIGVREPTEADATRRLAPVRRLVSPVPVVAPQIMALARAVANRYAGTLTDVLRFAVPPRHARTERSVLAAAEKQEPLAAVVTAPDRREASLWCSIPGGASLLRRLEAGEAPRAVWTHVGLPGHARELMLAAARASLAAGRGVLVVVPDVHDVERLVPVLADGLDEEVVRLVASDGPSVRVRSHLRVLLGMARVVVGTRSAAWAPVVDLGLAICWDDGDDSLSEQRAPYPHAAQVLAMRAEPERCALLLGSPSRSTWAAHLVATGWAVSLRPERATVRERAPRVQALDGVDLNREGGPARVPTPAWRAIREGLDRGPVLVQVPRSGYVPQLVCGTCREIARCQRCSGSLALTDVSRHPVCTRCGAVAEHWRCPECGGRRLRAVRIGARRSAEELGRAFPQVPVVVSEASSGVVADLDGHPRIVVATPGAEPESADGYAAVVLLDGALATSLPGLGGGEEAVRRWFHAASLARADGHVVVAGGGDTRVMQALVRWDPVTFAERDLAERRELRFPPTVRAASLEGGLSAVADLLATIELPTAAEVLGPVPAPRPSGPPGGGGGPGDDRAEDGGEVAGECVRAILRAPLAHGAELSTAIRAGMAVRSAHKREGVVRVRVDPREL